MSMHRRNKARNQTRKGQGPKGYDLDAYWFMNNVKRQRNRNKIAKASRRKNRV